MSGGGGFREEYPHVAGLCRWLLSILISGIVMLAVGMVALFVFGASQFAAGVWSGMTYVYTLYLREEF